MRPPRIAIYPLPKKSGDVEWATDAIRQGGGEAVRLEQGADALFWMPAGSPSQLGEVLAAHPALRWVQLTSAGIEHVANAGLLTDGRLWTCAKGAYAEPVAEHAFLLALAGLRRMPERISAKTWGRPGGTSLYEQPVTVIGGGGIAEAILRLCAPWRVKATVVRRRATPFPGAVRTLTTDALDEGLRGALIVFLALALTPETVGIIGARQLATMGDQAWLVNVARGRHVDTDALTAALAAGSLGGAALDVTDPEPLPDDHPLWSEPRCIITPHTANTAEMTRPRLAARLRANVAHFAAGERLEGVIDAVHGY